MIKSEGIKYILISSFYFSLMNVFVKLVSRIPSYETSFFRALVALVICYYTIKKAGIYPWGNNRKYLILRGIFGTIGLLSFFFTLQKIPLATAVTIQYLSPIFSVILAGFLLKEYAKPIQWLFFAVSFSGILIIKGFDTSISLFYLLIGILSALASGFAYNYIRKLKDYDHPLVTVFYFPLTTVPLVAPYTLYYWVQPHGIEWLYLIMVGVTTQQAQVYMTKAYQAEEMAKVANFNYIGTIYAMFFGYFIFNEKVGLVSIIGIILIITGSILSARFRTKDSLKIK